MVVGGQRYTVYFLATFLALLKTSLLLANGEPFDHQSMTRPPVSWTNNGSDSSWDSNGLTLKPLLVNGDFVCGFHCIVEENNTCLFAISIFNFTSIPHIDSQIVWAANRNNPVGHGAQLQLSQQGDLTLQNVDSTLIWSTNTTGKSVSGLKLTDQGNLMLFDGNNDLIWQSFDHPTDSLVLGQRLVSGQKLVASMSDTNWSEGLYSFSIDNNGYFVASVELDATIVYYKSNESQLRSQTGQFYAELTNTSFGVGLSPRSGVSFIQLGSDGHFLCFSSTGGYWLVDDLFKNQFHECDYPLVCGNYGICSTQGCSCPTYFKQRYSLQASPMCAPYIPISCESPYQHSLLELKNVDYVPGVDYHIADTESCKQACLKNCSCKYVVFQHNSNSSSSGRCFLRSEAFSFKRVNSHNYQSVFLKVHSSSVKPPFSYTNIISDFSWESKELILDPIFVNRNFVCGFHCKLEENNTCLFAISTFHFDFNYYTNLKMVWSANRNNPVGGGATLQLSQQGDLTLQDVDGTPVWSTKTAGKSVSGLKLTNKGNLLLFDGNNKTVWQSFDHPTDCLTFGQTLVSGQKLKSNFSATEWREGLFSFLIDNRGFVVASAESDANLVYYRSDGLALESETGSFYVEFTKTSLGFGLSPVSDDIVIQLGSDGHLRSFEWEESEWKEVDLFENQLDRCDYPLACGKYGICSAGGCSCPEPDDNETRHFKPINLDQPDLGCSPSVPLTSCKSRLLEINNVSCSTLLQPDNSYITDIESCKQTCLNNCSCKYAAFRSNGSNSSSGWCSFGSEALSFKREVDRYYNPSVFLKLSFSTEYIPQRDLPSPRKRRWNAGVILGSTLGATFSVLLICTFLLLQIKKDPKDVEEDYLGHISGTSTRFSYEELKDITNNFSNKLGEGGFGCVFQGTLPSSTQVAVKCLDGFGPVKKSFIAEVETIGSIHHFNLVGLVGFCAEKVRMLLVYERKMIVDIAKGLAYLHEGCRQKIIHLDIKPQNILLDENFNAKVSDFGLSKLVGREQSQVVTTMRGTPGYMAPEWLNSVITEKVDVYSFGIVVLEILCGRKNVDRSQPEEDVHLVSLFKRKVEDGQLLDLVDKYNEKMQSHATEVVEMMKVAACCLQVEYGRRPSMSIVVNFLEGKMDDENKYDFSNPPAPAEAETLGHQTDTATLIPSVLSGPR
ncbi:hypothetical protein SLEP1_g39824 [Rubroshorea leprosula]|uniref:non-specific serine/threonine protein kinase n=1 Tax=Rubroshorea leprosula TaxID=152421 RepID=A0AAV5L1T2_9ROSI|nr:hypothetical protein SLEP1_g39824 [Rubroshorea leprosula]